MKKNNDNISDIKEMLESLNAESLPQIDFDKLKGTLSHLLDELPVLYLSGEEHLLLKKDYIERISGMVKAITAARQNRDDLENTLEYLEGLADKKSDDLIRQYRIISARFRDTFPASFGLVKQPSKNSIKAANLN
ncbi:MAG: hypothetical protein ABIJ12_06095 [bacterium]